MRADLGSHAFAAQYLQKPAPAEGSLIKKEWLRRYQTAPLNDRSHTIVQSWDTASKAGTMNDYSVCVTLLVKDRHLYVLDVYRQRLEFPTSSGWCTSSPINLSLSCC